MKLIVCPFQKISNPLIPEDFYLKPDTALAKPGDDFYWPLTCAKLKYSLCYIIRIDRLGRAIKPAFASRYYKDANVGINISGLKTVVDFKFWPAGTMLDYSLHMPRMFYPKEDITHLDLQIDERKKVTYQIPGEEEVCNKISLLSHFIYLKMGDMILMELHKPQPVKNGMHIRVIPCIDFYIKKHIGQ